MRLIRFLLHQQNEDVYGTRQYRRSGQVKYAPAPLVHCILSPRNAHLFIQGVLKLMVESSPLYCLEEPDTNENTALLEALYFSSEAELVEIATYLIKAGANVHAQNKYGEGCLHLLLRRLSACNNVNMDKSRRSAIVGLVENLLRLECDPKLKNNEGYTPFDAARSPAAWSIYCEAFLKAEKNIETYVFGLIGTTNLQHLASLGVQQAGKPSLAQDNSIFRPQNIMSATDKPCYLCGRVTGDQNDWAVPFDEFHSVVVEEMEVTIHMKLYHHPEGEICLHVRDEDSCGLLDYYPDRMSFQRRRDRAWRIQKALELWKDGYFVGHG
jgi:hypothetical protein